MLDITHKLHMHLVSHEVHAFVDNSTKTQHEDVHGAKYLRLAVASQPFRVLQHGSLKLLLRGANLRGV